MRQRNLKSSHKASHKSSEPAVKASSKDTPPQHTCIDEQQQDELAVARLPLSPNVLAVLSGVFGALLYMDTVDYDWTLDDAVAVVNNPDVKGDNGLTQLWRNDFWGTPIVRRDSHKSYRPLSVLSFRLNGLVTGITPSGFHFWNVVLYGLCCTTVCLAVFVRSRDPSRRRVSYGTAAATMIFTVHPIHTEAVASVVGRTEILGAIFASLAFATYQLSVTSQSYSRSNAWLVGFACLVVCGLLCKELVIAVPAICITPDICRLLSKLLNFSSPGTVTKKVLTRVGSGAVVAILYLAIRVFSFQGTSVNGRFEDNPLRFIPKEEVFLTALYLQTQNLRLLVFPLEQSADYSYDAIPIVKSTSDSRLIFPTIPFYFGLLAIGIAALYCAVQMGRSEWITSMAWVVFPIVPTSHIVTIGLVLAERTLFLPSIGICLAVGILVDWLTIRLNTRTGRSMIFAALLVVVVAFSKLTTDRSPVWRNETTLWKSVHMQFPRNVKGIYGVAQTETDANIRQTKFRELLEIYPFHCYALVTLQRYSGHKYYHRYDEAVNLAERAATACYYKRGKIQFASAMDELVVELVRVSKTGNCDALALLARVFSIEKWAKADKTRSIKYKSDYTSCIGDEKRRVP